MAAPPGLVASQLRDVRGLRGTAAAREALLGVAFVALITALHVFNAAFIEGELLNFSGEWNVPTFATALIFFAAAASCVRASRALEGSEASAWTAVAVIVALLGAEAIAGLHEEIEEIGDLRVAVLIATPLAGAIAVVLLARPLRALRSPAPLLLIAGGLLLIATQASAALTGSTEIAGAPKRLLSIFQEGGEMLSACFVLAAAGAAYHLTPGGRDHGGAGEGRSPSAPGPAA